MVKINIEYWYSHNYSNLGYQFYLLIILSTMWGYSKRFKEAQTVLTKLGAESVVGMNQ